MKILPSTNSASRPERCSFPMISSLGTDWLVHKVDSKMFSHYRYKNMITLVRNELLMDPVALSLSLGSKNIHLIMTCLIINWNMSDTAYDMHTIEVPWLSAKNTWYRVSQQTTSGAGPAISIFKEVIKYLWDSIFFLCKIWIRIVIITLLIS